MKPTIFGNAPGKKKKAGFRNSKIFPFAVKTLEATENGWRTCAGPGVFVCGGRSKKPYAQFIDDS